MSNIQWPAGFVPGFTDNFCSNEVIVTGITVDAVWQLLATPAWWPSYYANSANPRFYDDKGPQLVLGDRFYFETFGFPVEARVVECLAPVAGQPARLAWHGWAGSNETDRLDVHHAWLIEALSENRVRILTQETQVGVPAKHLASDPSHPMIHGHQQWLDGMVQTARQGVQAGA